jgi:uncharacterized protein (DUF1499 family)
MAAISSKICGAANRDVMRLWGYAAIALVLPILTVSAASILLHPDETFPGGLFVMALGDPFLGDVNFATYQRRSSPNEALFCSKDVCSAPDKILGSVPITQNPVNVMNGLQSLIETAVRSNGESIERRAMTMNGDGIFIDFLVRTPVLRFPDTLNIALLTKKDEPAASIALLSRSRIGRSDRGVNRARLERIAAALQAVMHDRPLDTPQP